MITANHCGHQTSIVAFTRGIRQSKYACDYPRKGRHRTITRASIPKNKTATERGGVFILQPEDRHRHTQLVEFTESEMETNK